MTRRKMAIALTTSVRILLVGIAYRELAVHYACTYNYGKPYVLFVFHQQEILCKSMGILRGGTTVGER